MDGATEPSLASKLHLRYALPSLTNSLHALLPRPHLVAKHRDNSLVFPAETDPRPLRVWVATGNDSNFDFVMWSTITACVLGVIKMIVDISSVAKWDQTG